MSMQLRNFQKPVHAQQFNSSASFLAKNKITINNPKQAHFSVEGVQSYAPEQIKALKQRQDRTFQGREGTFAPLKVVLLSDQIIDDKDEVAPSAKKKNQSPKQPAKIKPSRKRINPRNALSTNNQVIVKLERETKKKQDLEKQMEKLSKKYKEHFKGVDLKEGINVPSKQTSIEQEESEDYEEEVEGESTKKNDATTHYKSSKAKIKKQQENDRSQENSQDEDIDQKPLAIGLKLVRECTSSYSERLGTAVHSLFN